MWFALELETLISVGIPGQVSPEQTSFSIRKNKLFHTFLVDDTVRIKVARFGRKRVRGFAMFGSVSGDHQACDMSVAIVEETGVERLPAGNPTGDVIVV